MTKNYELLEKFCQNNEFSAEEKDQKYKYFENFKDIEKCKIIVENGGKFNQLQIEIIKNDRFFKCLWPGRQYKTDF